MGKGGMGRYRCIERGSHGIECLPLVRGESICMIGRIEGIEDQEVPVGNVRGEAVADGGTDGLPARIRSRQFRVRREARAKGLTLLGRECVVKQDGIEGVTHNTYAA